MTERWDEIGWEAYYKESQQHDLGYMQQRLQSGDYSEPGFPDSKVSLENQVENIQALFIVAKLLEEAGIPQSFIGLTHTMIDYPNSVIKPMKQLLEEGKVQEAVTLYKQPRRYHR
ncbi:MAG TPA: hypothetical protein VLH19_02005 [Patescibacteria group bacterium]|nr:hypothetical protein [Patescibacteria group bacterium]